MQSLILIIDTAHPTARLIFCDEEKILAERQWINTPKVGTDLLVYIEELLQELNKKVQDIMRVAVHTGPGSFGLVRTGVTTATLLAQSVGAELVPVTGDTPESLIEESRTAKPVSVIEPRYEI